MAQIPSDSAMRSHLPTRQARSRAKATPRRIIDGRAWQEDVRSSDRLEPALRWKYQIQGIFKTPDLPSGPAPDLRCAKTIGAMPPGRGGCRSQRRRSERDSRGRGERKFTKHGTVSSLQDALGAHRPRFPGRQLTGWFGRPLINIEPGMNLP